MCPPRLAAAPAPWGSVQCGMHSVVDKMGDSSNDGDLAFRGHLPFMHSVDDKMGDSSNDGDLAFCGHSPFMHSVVDKMGDSSNDGDLAIRGRLPFMHSVKSDIDLAMGGLDVKCTAHLHSGLNMQCGTVFVSRAHWPDSRADWEDRNQPASSSCLSYYNEIGLDAYGISKKGEYALALRQEAGLCAHRASPPLLPRGGASSVALVGHVLHWSG